MSTTITRFRSLFLSISIGLAAQNAAGNDHLYESSAGANSLAGDAAHEQTDVESGSNQFFRSRVNHEIVLGANQIENSDFSDGMTGWDTWTNKNISADFQVVDGELLVDNISDTTAGEMIRLRQSPLTLEEGKYYTISFEARAANPRVVSFGFSTDLVQVTVDSHEMKTYSYVYPHVGPTDTNARLRIQFAASLEPVFIDNVQVRKGGIAYPSLPEILLTESGQEVTDIETWENLRRPELLKFFRDEIFGYPPDPATYTIDYEIVKDHIEILRDDEDVNNDGYHTLVNMTINGPYGSLTLPCPIYLPASVDEGPVPVIIYVKQRSPVTSETTDSVPLSLVFGKGFGVAILNGGVLANEDANNSWMDDPYLFPIFNDTARRFDERSESEWGSLSMWAWAGSRMIDFMETQTDKIDIDKIGTVGHSRGGKGALWFGVTDQRVALTIPNNAGMGGDNLARHPGYRSQNLEGSFWPIRRWYAPNFLKYPGMDANAPFDFHQLMALVAPRLLASGASSRDRLADPVGEWQSIALAQPVYGLYGLLDKTWDLTDGPHDDGVDTVLQNGALHHHKKGNSRHSFNSKDWRFYLDFANSHWR